MNVLSLYTGIGGFDLGLERAGMRITAQCEIDPFCNAVLEKHWPKVWRHNDVRTLTHALVQRYAGPIELICGGFPCQDVSDAGYREGIAGRRSGLWNEFARLLRDVPSAWGIVENVDGLRRRGLGTILGDLAACGRDAEWRVFGRSDFGAPHVRERIFILAYPAGQRLDCHGSSPEVVCQILLEEVERRAFPREAFGGSLGRSGKRVAHPGLLRVDDGIPSRLDVCRVAALGNAIIPQIPELIGRVLMETVNK